jgi:hypothetical protein
MKGATRLSEYSRVSLGEVALAGVFLALLGISLYFIFVPDISPELTWLLLVLFSVLASTPVAEQEE